MKIFLSRFLHAGFIATLMTVASSQSLFAENLDVLGNLQARGQIRVMSDGAPSPVRLADTTYAYIAGDTIQTVRGTGVLSIAGLGRIALAPATEAVARNADKGISLSLNAGAVAYSLAPGSDFTVRAGGMTVQPARSPVRKVNAGAEGNLTGWISIGEDGRVKVGSRNGRIEISRGGSMQVVEAGRTSAIEFQGGKLIATQAGGAGAGGGATGGFGMENLILLAMAAAGAAVGIAMSGNNNKPLASP